MAQHIGGSQPSRASDFLFRMSTEPVNPLREPVRPYSEHQRLNDLMRVLNRSEKRMEKAGKMVAASVCLCVVLIISSIFLKKLPILIVLTFRILGIGSAISYVASVAVIAVLNFKSELLQREIDSVSNRLILGQETTARRLSRNSQDYEQRQARQDVERTQKLRSEIITMFKIRNSLSCIPDLPNDSRWSTLNSELINGENKNFSLQDENFQKYENDTRSKRLVFCDRDSDCRMQTSTNENGTISHDLTSKTATTPFETVNELEMLFMDDFQTAESDSDSESKISCDTDIKDQCRIVGTENIERPKENKSREELKSSSPLELSEAILIPFNVNRCNWVRNQFGEKSQDSYSEHLQNVSRSIWNLPNPESSSGIIDQSEQDIVIEDDKDDDLKNMLQATQFFKELFKPDKRIRAKSHKPKHSKRAKLNINPCSQLMPSEEMDVENYNMSKSVLELISKYSEPVIDCPIDNPAMSSKEEQKISKDQSQGITFQQTDVPRTDTKRSPQLHSGVESSNLDDSTPELVRRRKYPYVVDIPRPERNLSQDELPETINRCRVLRQHSVENKTDSDYLLDI